MTGANTTSVTDTPDPPGPIRAPLAGELKSVAASATRASALLAALADDLVRLAARLERAASADTPHETGR